MTCGTGSTLSFLIIEDMQKARTSPVFDDGVLSLFWDPAIQHYARLIAEAMA